MRAKVLSKIALELLPTCKTIYSYWHYSLDEKSMTQSVNIVTKTKKVDNTNLLIKIMLSTCDC